MARNQWQQWMLSPFYLKFMLAQDPYPSGTLYKKILQAVSLPSGERVLLAGCGSGAKAKEIADAGYDVTATDYSFPLIDVAQSAASGHLQFYQHDLRLPFWSNYFGFAFNTSRSFGSYDTKREHDNVLRTISGSLNAGAYLLMEYINTSYMEKYPFKDVVEQIGETVFSITHHQDETHFYSTITVTDPSIAAPETYVHRKEKLSEAQLTAMLAAQGLIVEQVYGDDEFGAYIESDSPRLILLARKTTPGKGDAEKRLYSDGRTTDALT